MTATMNIDQATGRNAGGPITKYRFVKLDTSDATGETVVQCDTAGELAYGVSLFSVSSAEINLGKGCTVVIDGRMIMEAGGAVAVGDLVTTDASGRAVAATSGDYIMGQCDEPASGAGDQCSIYIESYGKA